jgi:hypothetical protein
MSFDVDPTLGPLSERIDSELALAESVERLRAAVADNPKAKAALHEMFAALLRWGSTPPAD